MSYTTTTQSPKDLNREAPNPEAPSGLLKEHVAPGLRADQHPLHGGCTAGDEEQKSGHWAPQTCALEGKGASSWGDLDVRASSGFRETATSILYTPQYPSAPPSLHQSPLSPPQSPPQSAAGLLRRLLRLGGLELRGLQFTCPSTAD